MRTMMSWPRRTRAKLALERAPGLSWGCVLLGVCLFASLLAARALAESSRPSWEVGGGGSIPIGRFADTTSAGFTIAFGPEVEQSKRIALGGEVAFSRYGTASRGGEFTNLAGDLYGAWRLRPGADVCPYLRCGLAVHFLLVNLAAEAFLETLGFTSGDWGVRYGEFVGGGVAVRRGRSVEWRADASYHHVSNADTPLDYVDLTLRIVFIRSPAQ